MILSEYRQDENIAVYLQSGHTEISRVIFQQTLLH